MYGVNGHILLIYSIIALFAFNYWTRKYVLLFTYSEYLTPSVIIYVRFIRFADCQIYTRRRNKFDERYTKLSLDRLMHVYTLFIHTHLMCCSDEYAVGISTPRITHYNGQLIIMILSTVMKH